MRPRRVLVTGGAGFLGSHLCEREQAYLWKLLGDDVRGPVARPVVKEDDLCVGVGLSQ